MIRRTRRDMRSLAADLAGDIGEATKLLQHSSQRLTERHFDPHESGEIEGSEMSGSERGTRKGMATQAQIRAYWVDCLWQKKGYDSPQEFLEKDNCFACGFDGPGTLERAHITALSEGGGNDADNLHMLCRCCHHDSEMLSGDEYWRWFMQRNIMDRLLSESVKRGFNAFSAIVRCNDCSPRKARPQ